MNVDKTGSNNPVSGTPESVAGIVLRERSVVGVGNKVGVLVGKTDGTTTVGVGIGVVVSPEGVAVKAGSFSLPVAKTTKFLIKDFFSPWGVV